MALEDHRRLFQSARRVVLAGHRGRLDERRDRVGDRGDDARDPQRLDPGRELGPALEAVLAGDDELRVGQRGLGAAVMLAHAALCVRVTRASGAQQLLRLLLVLLEVGTGGKVADGHTNLLSWRLESARIRLKEGSS